MLNKYTCEIFKKNLLGVYINHSFGRNDIMVRNVM